MNKVSRIATNQSGQTLWQWQSTAFGEQAANEDVDGDGQLFALNLRFPGQYYDQESGLNYNYFRDYDPSTGRYLQSDPIGLAGGVNTYGYALQNPLRYTDPFGLVSWECTSLSMGGSAVVVGAGIIRYRCESECVNGSKTIAQIEVSYAGVDIGIEAGMVESRGNEINDNNSQPNPDVFNGEYFEASANYTVGIGYGVSAVSWNRGQATGVNHGITGGVGIGAGEISGTSQVVSSRTVQCDDECN